MEHFATTGWRLLDTGVRSGAENMALDEALLLARSRNGSPDTIRFLQFSPPAALVGFHQSVEQEIRLEYCRQAGIDVNRRITGGGAILFDEAQLGWEIIASRRSFSELPFSEALHRKLSHGLVLGLRALGIEASFRPRNDIEVKGRKISGTGGVEEGDAFLFQSTLLLDFDVSSMIRALRIPTEKLKQASLDAAADRVTWISKELGYLPSLEEIKIALVKGFEKALGITLQPVGLLPEEEEALQNLLPTFRSRGWIFGTRRKPSQVEHCHGIHRSAGAVMRADVAIDIRRRRLRSVLFTGDFFVSPSRTILDLEARLKDLPLEPELVEATIEEFWKTNRPMAVGFDHRQLWAAVKIALDKAELFDLGFDADEIAGLFPVNGTPKEIFSKNISLLLLPYCSKPPDCEYRHSEDCANCGECSVGEAYCEAEGMGLRVLTVTNFDHLMQVLRDAKVRQVEAFFGCCCEAFFNRHCDDFRRAEIPGILVDIQSSTCYDLGHSHAAYRGEFEEKTELRTDLLRKILSLVHQSKLSVLPVSP